MIESLFLPLMLPVTLLSVQAGEPAPTPTQPDGARTSVPAKITTEDRAVLRCSAAFAIVGARQAQQPGESALPEITTRGREFFVVSLASIMEELGLDRPAIEREVRVEAENLVKNNEVDKIMPACLLMLQAAGL